jgi:hypothetical protein
VGLICRGSFGGMNSGRPFRRHEVFRKTAYEAMALCNTVNRCRVEHPGGFNAAEMSMAG